MRKTYIPTKPLMDLRKTPKKCIDKIEEQDKIARLYALAKKLHVKIGGNNECI